MPNDLYQWEEAGGRVHHCPQCKKPLTTPQARTRCLGEHVEWCKRYHTQLFKKGTSDQCAPCKACEEEHLKRHREIANKILELRLLKAAQEPPPASPLTPRALNTLQESLNTPSKSHCKSGKSKKPATSNTPRIITQADIDHISHILHPTLHPSDTDSITEDEDIKRNVYFHKNTSSLRETRNTFFNRTGHRFNQSKDTYSIPSAEIDGYLQLLNISPITKAISAEEKAIVAALRKCISDDLVQVHNERQQTLMRKEGFWRWASKKAYKRFVGNGGVWSKRDGEMVAVMREEGGAETSTTEEGTEDGSTDVGSEETGASTELTTPSGEGEEGGDAQSYMLAAGAAPSTPTIPAKLVIDSKVSVPKTANFAMSSVKNTATTPASDGWSTVPISKKGNSKAKKPTPNLKLTLVHNHGLAKMVQSPAVKSSPFSPNALGLLGEED